MRRLCLDNPTLSARHESICTCVSLPIRSRLLRFNSPYPICLRQFFTTFFQNLESALRSLIEGVSDRLMTSQSIPPMNYHYGKRAHPAQRDNKCVAGSECPTHFI